MSSNQLLAAGLASALGLGSVGIRALMGKGGSRGGKRKGGGSKRVVSSGLGGMNPTNYADLKVKPPINTNVPKHIPKNVGRMVSWDVFKTQQQISWTGSAVTETNFQFTLSMNPQASTWASLFDQYSIPQVSIEFDSLTPPGQTTSSPVLYTALDFDNSSAISTVAAIEEYDSCEVIVMAPEKRHLRSVRPSVKTGVLASGSLSAASTSGPVWVDCGNTSVAFFGIRSIVSSFGTGSMLVTITMYNCYRNHI
jgi:hypothetical protein